MNLPQPVTVQPPPYTRANGEIRTAGPIAVAELDVLLIDSASQRAVRAQIARFPQSVTLWEGDAYDAAGDYTQAQAEARLLEVLGPDLKSGLEALFVRPQVTR
jgi:hypothetical protein